MGCRHFRHNCQGCVLAWWVAENGRCVRKSVCERIGDHANEEGIKQHSPGKSPGHHMTRPVILVPNPPFFYVLFYFTSRQRHAGLCWTNSFFFFFFTLIPRCEGYSAQAQGGSPGKAPNRAQHGGPRMSFFFFLRLPRLPRMFHNPSGGLLEGKEKAWRSHPCRLSW